MTLTAAQRAEQQKQAEELLFSGPQALGFAKSLFFGQFRSELLFPYPEIKPQERETTERAAAELRRFLDERVDAVAIDRNADIPREVIDGLGQLGVLGWTAPVEFGGRGMSQLSYVKLMELIGGHCSSTAVFVNAHHSIGLRALILFGTPDQQRRWLPEMCTGAKIAAFALTEPEAGSDAGNVQTLATPSADGFGYSLTGQKCYITSGGIAQVLTVMARTPAEASPGRKSGETKVTAFLVTPDMEGFEVVEERMDKCGIRGTATARLAFHNMGVPAENVLGPLGKGLKVALTVLDFGRTTFGASCTGAAKTCLKAAVQHAKTRVQFKQHLGEFELVKKKIAFMAANVFAMEAATSQCAAFIDKGADDYMIETAMLKVWSTDALWQIVNDTIQIFGGKAYFTDQPYERMLRDARINMIGEGANDVLRAFIALVGMRGVGEKLKDVLDAVQNPLKDPGKLWGFVKKQVETRLSVPEVPVKSPNLRAEAHELAKRVRDFGLAVQSVLRQHRENILERQYVHERIADAAADLYASSCTLSRLDYILSGGTHPPLDLHRDVHAGKHFLKLADRRIRHNLAALADNDDEQTTATANAVLEKS